jgi:hypothetical protein
MRQLISIIIFLNSALDGGDSVFVKSLNPYSSLTSYESWFHFADVNP